MNFCLASLQGMTAVLSVAFKQSKTPACARQMHIDGGFLAEVFKSDPTCRSPQP